MECAREEGELIQIIEHHARGSPSDGQVREHPRDCVGSGNLSCGEEEGVLGK